MAANGCTFAQIPNDLALAWARLHLSPVEYSVLLVLQVKILGAYDPVRRCVGRRNVRISNKEIGELAGFPRQRVHEAIHRLAERGVLVVVDAGRGRRKMTIALCRNPRLMRPAADAPEATLSESSLPADLSPELKANAERWFAGLASRAGVTQTHEGSES